LNRYIFYNIIPQKSIVKKPRALPGAGLQKSATAPYPFRLVIKAQPVYTYLKGVAGIDGPDLN